MTQYPTRENYRKLIDCYRKINCEEKARVVCTHLVKHVKLDADDIDTTALYTSIMSARDDVSEGGHFVVLEAVSMFGNRLGVTLDDDCDGCIKIRDQLRYIRTNKPLEVARRDGRDRFLVRPDELPFIINIGAHRRNSQAPGRNVCHEVGLQSQKETILQTR